MTGIQVRVKVNVSRAIRRKRVAALKKAKAVGGRQRAEGRLEGDWDLLLTSDHMLTDFGRGLYPVGLGNWAFIFSKNFFPLSSQV